MATAPAPLPPASPAHLTWHETTLAAEIKSAIRKLVAINDRLQLVATQHGSRDLSSATCVIGSVKVRDRKVGEVNPKVEHRLEPTVGASAVAELWGVLDGLRNEAIEAQLVAEGHKAVADWRITEAEECARLDCLHRLMDEAPAVSEVV